MMNRRGLRVATPLAGLLAVVDGDGGSCSPAAVGRCGRTRGVADTVGSLSSPLVHHGAVTNLGVVSRLLFPRAQTIWQIPLSAIWLERGAST